MSELPPRPDGFMPVVEITLNKNIETLGDVADMWREFIRLEEEHPGYLFILKLIEEYGNE